MTGLTRRVTLLTAMAAAGAAHAAPPARPAPPAGSLSSERVDPTTLGAPPAGKDSYGLDAFFKSQPYLEKALRELNEPALLTPQALVSGPTFRLLEIRRRPRSARIIFDRVDGSASVVLKEYPLPASAGAMFGGHPPPPEFLNRPIAGVLGLDTQRALRLRQLLEDVDRFWNGAADPPKWDQLTADALNEILVTADGWTVVLEGRVGAKRHAILRSTPPDESWLGQISEQVFGKRSLG